MHPRKDKGEPTIACDFTMMETEQRERYRALRHQLSKDLHEVRELEDGYAFRHSSEAEARSSSLLNPTGASSSVSRA